MKTEQEYEDAIIKRRDLKKELIKLDKNILTYENEYKLLTLNSIKEVREFVCCEALEGAKFIFNGQLYEMGDIDYIEKEYGYESVHDGLHSASLEDIIDSYGLIRKI